jgi:hypothetical protein
MPQKCWLVRTPHYHRCIRRPIRSHFRKTSSVAASTGDAIFPIEYSIIE